jgi:alkylated DNA repair dioxygenase AlkB
MLSLFEETTPSIDGLIYIPDFISVEKEKSLLSNIDKQPWLNDLKRRVQHYGYKYDYRARNIDKSLSLGSGAMMQFEKDGIREEIYLEPRSLIILSDAARYKWTHAIPARKSDKVYGQAVARNRRVSVTFRNVILS